MRTKLAALVLALGVICAAPAAPAQEYGRGDAQWREHSEITVHTQTGRIISAQRGDRLFRRLVGRPYFFEPGMTYVYNGACSERGCVVQVFSEGRWPIDSFLAPPLR